MPLWRRARCPAPKNEKRDMLCQEEFMFSLLACNVFRERLPRHFACLGCLVCLRVARFVSTALQHTLSTWSILKLAPSVHPASRVAWSWGNLPSVATAPLQPRSPHSRWKRSFCFSLAGKVRWRLASGIVAEQLGNCKGTWPNSSIFLIHSSRSVENLESWLGSIWQNDKSLRGLYDKCWQKGFLIQTTDHSQNSKGKQIEIKMRVEVTSSTHPFESSWLNKMQGLTAHLKCWNCWKREIQ